MKEPIILLVQDNQDHADLMFHALDEASYSECILHLKYGEEALDYLFHRGDYSDPQTNPRPALILLDLGLPKLSGIEVLRQIKASEELLRIPVVILTCSGSDSNISEAYASHANGYIVTPMSFSAFENMANAVISYWMNWNKLPEAV